MNLFICKHCGNLAELLNKSGVPLVCCGEDMTEIIPNTVEASVEKHLPEITVSGNSVSVQVGSTIHPMDSGHFIPFVYVETKNGGQHKLFKPGDEPKASYVFTDDKPVAVYAYCNLHGLWKTEIN
jgi:superoxide reductase